MINISFIFLLEINIELSLKTSAWSKQNIFFLIEPPEIEPIHFVPDLKEGLRTQLTCMVTEGDLPITINWLKDGRHLQHDPDVDLKQMSDYSMVGKCRLT